MSIPDRAEELHQSIHDLINDYLKPAPEGFTEEQAEIAIQAATRLLANLTVGIIVGDGDIRFPARVLTLYSDLVDEFLSRAQADGYELGGTVQ